MYLNDKPENRNLAYLIEKITLVILLCKCRRIVLGFSFLQNDFFSETYHDNHKIFYEEGLRDAFWQ